MSGIVLADRMSVMNESATLALNAKAKRLAADGKTIYNLTAGELAASTPDYIQKAVAETLHLNKYTPVAGLPELRQEIAAQARSFYGLDWIQDDNVVVTAGAKPALAAALLTIINPGDEVIVPVPAWVSYFNLIELAGGKVVEVPLSEDFDLDPKAIIGALTPRTKAVIINSPQNPTGAVFSRQSLEELAAALKGKNVTVLSDDIYAKLSYIDNYPLPPTAGFEQTIIINGFSKSQALTGWRIGYIIADRIVAAAMTSLLSHVMGNAAVPSQYAALAALALGDTPPRETIDTLKRQRVLVDKALKGTPRLKYHLPGGAFYFFLDLRQITTDTVKWCEVLLEKTGVALVPGEAFSAPGFARLSFVTDEKTLVGGLKLLHTYIEEET